MNRVVARVVLASLILPAAALADEPGSPTPAELQAKVDAVLKKVRPAVVAISKDGRASSSGVIATEDGLVLTHGHHQLVPSDTVSIILADGREASARCRLTRRTPLFDCSVLQILDPGPWPYAELGEMHEVRPGDWCLHLGHPWGLKPERPAVPRMGSVVKTADVVLTSSCMIVGGDSGGPLFDAEGRIIGLCRGLAGLETDFPTEHASVTVLRQTLEEFRDLEARRKAGALRSRINRQQAPAAWEPAWDAAGKATVQVYCDGDRRSLGVIVDEGGLILTKRSELFGEISCRLEDGRTPAATVVSTSQPFDLALLRIPETGLPPISWTENTEPRSGTVVVVPGPDRTALGLGIVGDARVREVPAVRGYLRLEVKPAAGGMRVTRFSPGSHASDVLRIGDVITHIEGVDVRAPDEYARLTENLDQPAGDRVPVCCERDSRPMQVSVSLSRDIFAPDWERRDLNGRRSGFPSIFSHDAVIAPNDCGGPLIDGDGNAIGINIARADRHETLVIPAAIVRREIERLTRNARSGSGD